MGFLLDTHVLLWWLANDPKLSADVREIIRNPVNDSFVSAATIWEIAIKTSLGKLKQPDDLLAVLRDNRFQVLDISAEHCLNVGSLPWHHKDPFDRMLISQALVEGLTIITVDQKFKFYDVPLFSDDFG
ncbi:MULTISPECIES: type II toxin-antitoxin system VapC family toxin [Nostocales]|jgi:PIN domain nuclease of toxin-antitoxin system|uniref:Type II toxin-antitoxin system VapC family toxin n=2 Tax=Aphanizomenonaceae TaxID=1892259 RepID=A0ACC7S599_DOLFA|nr:MULTISPECIES: type II toxin-antitoxin system VapC family toxin [Nostocales]MBO1070101.1 type II toxin-antitoxin system VapC family toxin [Dolichospermum sp. DEX189]MDB9484636.1 type II toxin-antitoxin system VapC family toxin [Dolichospermum circinale CS-537/05]MDK2409822.1 type II toxin-antitoxin system VapC family toxin [Aphanizomenon sp. 202]MDK2459344.1 type II toxin-antitoxin system VapC family toxin [Aphanizomenon sp. PH219]MBD2278582.1 type II toxin-antitoxin system VapC family toxin